MRLCRIEVAGQPQAAFYDEQRIVPVATAARVYAESTHDSLDLGSGDDLLPLLPPDGEYHQAVAKLFAWLERNPDAVGGSHVVTTSEAQLLVPIPRPPKIFLLAGNYAKHIEEGGGIAAERRETFPYVFMKPPTTTLVAGGEPVILPKNSPHSIDYECELAVVIGRRAKRVSEAEALDYVAGYTIINDISNRRFQPNPDRKQREKDSFFDWLHGKWFDSFCPCGPCVASAATLTDPQTLDLKLSVGERVRQNSSTSHQIFPVAAVIEFISNICTLEPGDIISTGTPEGVGHTTGEYLQPGDTMRAEIEGIGTLVSTIRNEE